MVSLARRLSRPATRADLEALPANEKGEIIDGELYVQSRPMAGQSRVSTALALGLRRGGPDGDDDPPGWWILAEPGIELAEAPEIAPNLAAWRRERMPVIAPDDPITVVPDWICEVLSPSNRAYDRRVKFPFYARIGVEHLWVIDPPGRTVEIKQRFGTRWLDVASFAEDETMRAEPFPAIELRLSKLWLPR